MPRCRDRAHRPDRCRFAGMDLAGRSPAGSHLEGIDTSLPDARSSLFCGRHRRITFLIGRSLTMAKHPGHARIADDASDGIESIDAYYKALGRFVHTFAKVEFTVFLVLRHYAEMSLSAARVLLAGIRADQTQTRLKRVQEVGLIDYGTWEDVDRVLKQFSEINKLRNDLLHDTTVLSETGRGVVTNAARAHREGRFEQSLVSPEILDEATFDLRQIITHLNVKHMGKPDYGDPKVTALLRAPWRYKRQSLPPVESLKRE
jgi:hypothetical protein